MAKRRTKGSTKVKPIRQGDRTFVPIVTGTQARTFVGAEGGRKYGAGRFTLECAMSKLDIAKETLEICMYFDPANKKVVTSASQLLKRWYPHLPEGYPKPCGEGEMEFLEDKDFKNLYQDAVREAAAKGDEVKTLGPKDDPTAFHVVRRGKRIILPGE